MLYLANNARAFSSWSLLFSAAVLATFGLVGVAVGLVSPVVAAAATAEGAVALADVEAAIGWLLRILCQHS